MAQLKRVRLKRWFTIAIGVLLILLIALGSAGMGLIRQSFPQVNGTLSLAGLQAPVTIYRDEWGVPHLYAQTTHDLWMAQGFVHAQDRFWQMDFWRHIGMGRLAELFGEKQVKADQFLRTLGWARIAQQEVEQLDAQLRDELNAYAEGVNAYLADRPNSALSLEYAVLKLLNPDYKPEPWQPLHSILWGKVMAYDLSLNMEYEIERSILLKTLSLQQIDELFPPYPQEHPVILGRQQGGQKSKGGGHEEEPMVQGVASGSGIPQPEEKDAPEILPVIHALLGEPVRGVGSNNWVISGAHTTTGKPMLANDPHLGSQMPSIWYEMGLHCQPKGSTCPYEVAGVSFPGMLGIIVGHTDRSAWGVTNVGADVMDLFVERLNPDNSHQYDVNGHWEDLREIQETIQVAGGKAIVQTVRYTRHGPLLSDVMPELQQLGSPFPLPQPYGVALRWTALEPSRLHYAIPELNRAENWEAFRAAARDFDVPAQNLVYADLEGNIGYQMPGKIPIRSKGNGRYPVPGWTGEYDWQGYVPFEDLPKVLNPPDGILSTANNPVVDRATPLITKDWDYGYRAARIRDRLVAHTGPFSVADLQALQGDTYSLIAEVLVPLVQSLPLDNRGLKAARQLWQNWDFQLDRRSSGAALFEVFWKQLLAVTFQDELPERYWPDGDDRWMAVVQTLLTQPQSAWWDDRRTAVVESRDVILTQAFTQAVTELEQSLGRDPQSWQWGQLHGVTFRNATLGKSGIGAIEALFNRGPFPVSGNGETVNASRWKANQSYEVTHIASMRLVVDLGNLNHSQSIHTPGQSGHAFHRHYQDLVPLWRSVQSHPLLWDQEAIVAKAKAMLKLRP